jgi:DNA-binding transcriptional LysR family regulator
MATVTNPRRVRDQIVEPVAVFGPRRVLVREPELAELRAFCAAADLGSIGHAARELGVSQPALSKRLRALERVAGLELLQRSPRGVTLTAPGAKLYGAARRLLDSADAVGALIGEYSRESAPVRIAVSPTIAELWLPRALVELQNRREAHLSVEVISANSGIVRSMIREQRCDLGLAAVDPACACERGFTETIVWEDEVIVGVPLGHPWADVDEIDSSEFARTRIIRRDPGANSSLVVAAALKRIGLSQVRPITEIGSTVAAVSTAVRHGVPVLLPMSAARAIADGELLIRRVKGVTFKRAFALLMRGGLLELTPPARVFAQLLLGSSAAVLRDAGGWSQADAA